MYNPDSIDDRRSLGVKLINLLQEKKFVEENGSGERIFSFPVNDQVRVVIYTSIVGTQARSKDKDAIRIVGIYKSKKDNKERGLVKVSRVYRTGRIDSIIERTIERARDVWKRLHIVEQCPECQAPMFISKKGNLCCSDLCYLDK